MASSVSAAGTAAAGSSVRCLIPERRFLNGPVTRKLLLRTMGIVVAIWVVAGVPILLVDAPGPTAVALGLILPGGGFLYAGAPVLAGVSVVAFFLALGLWWASGNVLLPPLTHLATALLPLLVLGGEVWSWAQAAVPIAAVALVGAGLGTERLLWRRASQRGRALNERLADMTFPIPAAPSRPEVVEATPEELRWLRLPLDLALQPIESFEGFTWMDQFREAAVRYQLNFIGYLLALHTYTRTPAFGGYVAEAQRNAIEKMRDRRIWRYWALENLWGNLRWNPNPVAEDNVMYSGYFGLQIGLYQTVTGDMRHSEPGALTLEWSDRKSFAHDFGTIAEAEHRKMGESPLCLYPCEPNWSFAYCNTTSLNTQILHDRLHGTRYAEDSIPNFRRAYEDEFVRPDGRVTEVRSRRIGFALPFSAFNAADAIQALWLHPGLPDIARRTWWLWSERLVERGDGEATLRLDPPDSVDPGNYKIRTPGFAYAQAIVTAREFGHSDLADALQRELDRRWETVDEEDGRPRMPKSSTYVNLLSVMGRLNRENAVRNMIVHGMPEAWLDGPRLAEAAYPDAQVARADTDGEALSLVLRPGGGGSGENGGGPVRTTLALDRLRPEAVYRASGLTADRLTADAEGRAVVEVELGDRREIRVWPEA